MQYVQRLPGIYLFKFGQSYRCIDYSQHCHLFPHPFFSAGMLFDAPSEEDCGLLLRPTSIISYRDLFRPETISKNLSRYLSCLGVGRWQGGSLKSTNFPCKIDSGTPPYVTSSRIRSETINLWSKPMPIE